MKISFNARMGAKCLEDRLAKLVAEFGGVRGVFAGLGKILFNPTFYVRLDGELFSRRNAA